MNVVGPHEVTGPPPGRAHPILFWPYFPAGTIMSGPGGKEARPRDRFEALSAPQRPLPQRLQMVAFRASERHPAVAAHDVSGHIGGCVAGEEKRKIGNVGHGAKAAQRQAGL
jgi:hypothetical protein